MTMFWLKLVLVAAALSASVAQDTAGFNSDSCTCVPYTQCSDRPGIRSGGQCSNFIDVCCLNPISAVTPRPGPDNKYYIAKCGRRNPKGVDARVTGLTATQAQFGEFPWMVALYLTRNLRKNAVNQQQGLCGGSLIKPNVVLTAAHCVYRPYGVYPTGEMTVRIGDWDNSKIDELYTHVERRVVQVKIHEQYNNQYNFNNDYALLFLESPVELAPHIDTICLPDQNTAFDSTQCIVTGWGKDLYSEHGRSQNTLNKVTLAMIPRPVCQNALRAFVGSNMNVHPSSSCAGGNFDGEGICEGGSGGSPLVCPLLSDRDTYVLVGMVSYGIGCGRPGVPEVYANVIAGIDWIKQNY